MATWRFYESIVSFPFFRQVATHRECSGRNRPSLPWARVGACGLQGFSEDVLQGGGFQSELHVRSTWEL